jgi:uncharacterized protein YbaP (TraB family)
MRLLAACIALLVWASAPAASAVCAGENMLDALARSDPAAHAAIRARAAATPNGEGRFWGVERPGTPPSHLFGTFHTDQAVATVPPPAWQALGRARIALFELSAAEQAAMQARLAGDRAFAFDETAPPLSRRLDPASLAILGRALAARGIPLDQAERMQPWMLFSLLALPACHLETMAAGAMALDAVLAESASQAGIPQAGLETYEQALAAFHRIPPDRFLAMLVETSALLDREEDIFRTNLDLYAAGRLAEIDAFGRWLSTGPGSAPGSAALYDEVMNELIGARNRAWLGPLEDELARGGVFAAVGALHLPGREGLVELLRARGWTVTRLD